MAQDKIIKSIGCTVSLQDNSQIKTNISIIKRKWEKGGASIWRIINNDMNNLQFPSDKGIWKFHPNEKNTIVLAGADLEDQKSVYRTFLHLQSVPNNFLDFNQCGVFLSGSGMKFNPLPWQEVDYSFWFGCL